MKTKSVLSALNKVLRGNAVGNNSVIFSVGNRAVQVVDQGGNAVCLPMIDMVVVHNGSHTIKNLVSFLTRDLNDDQRDYLKTLRKMYSQTTNERLIEAAKTYQSMTQGVS